MKPLALGVLLGIVATCAAVAVLGLTAWWLGGVEE